MKPFLFTTIFVMISSFALLAQSPTTDHPILKEGFNQRIILEPSKPAILKNRETINNLRLLVNKMPTLSVVVPNKMEETISLPSQWKRIAPNMNVDLQAMYLSDRKDPAISCTLSLLVPGLGQLYNGQISKGIAFMFASYGSLAVGAVALSNHNNGLSTAGFVVAAISYLWSAFDAPLNSNAMNKQHGLIDISLNGNRHLFVQPSVSALRDTKGNYLPGSTNAGLAIAYSFGGE